MNETNSWMQKLIKKEAEEREKRHPHEKITGRAAKCTYCGRLANSRDTLPFFQERPDREYDEYYCGCYGWE